MRRALLAAAVVSAALVAACGSSTTESALTPSRFIAFGDGFSDLGQTGKRYTVNDGSVNVWSQYMVSLFGNGLTLTTAAAGGTSYATGNARIALKPDAAGNSATPTVTEQINTFVAGGGSFGANDVVIVSGGISDVVVQTMAVAAGTQSSAQAITNVKQAGADLATQVRRVVTAGAKYVVVVGAYNLAKSPWSVALGQGDLVLDAASRFNEAVLVNLVDLGANVLFIDAALHFNLVTSSPGSYNLTDSTTVVCNSVDAGAGIGTGAGKVNSGLCNGGTIVPGLDYSRYLFADGIYPTPQGHRLFGEYAYNRLRARW